MAGKKGSNLGNTNNKGKRKFSESAERRQLCDDLCAHFEQGLSWASFPGADKKTVKQYMKDFPSDFPPLKIERSIRIGVGLWEKSLAGITSGKIRGNILGAIFALKNKAPLEWRDRHDITSDDKPLVGIGLGASPFITGEANVLRQRASALAEAQAHNPKRNDQLNRSRQAGAGSSSAPAGGTKRPEKK